MTSPMFGASNPLAGDGGSNSISLPNWNVPIADADGKLTTAWRQYFQNTFYRVGGTNGASSSDLSMSLPEDAGIEETKIEIRNVRDDTWQFPPVSVVPIQEDPSARIEALEAAVYALTQEINSIKQGIQA